MKFGIDILYYVINKIMPKNIQNGCYLYDDVTKYSEFLRKFTKTELMFKLQ